jgi:hypothetical protein
MINKFSILGVILIVMAVSTSGAEYYKYTDKNGNVRFTDDLSQVPMDQRAGVQSYIEIQPPSEPPSVSPPKADSDVQPTTQAPTAEAAQLQKTREALMQRKTALDAEYQKLMDEKSKIDAERAAARSKARINTYNKKVAEFNEKIKRFEEKRSIYQQDMERFNADVQKHNASSKTQ